MSERLETGSCFCGAITAEMQGEPFWICYDHDDDCRRAIGGAVNVWVGYRPHQVTITSGKPAVFSKTPGISRSFCGACGTSIAYQDEGIKDELYLTLGFFDQPAGLPPSAHAYCGCPGSTSPIPCRVSRPIAGPATRPSARQPRGRHRA